MKYDAQREAEVQGTRIMMQNQTSAYMDLAARNTSKGSMRYHVFSVADENCDSVGERLSYFDELEGAKYFVANSSSVARLPYGAAILDYTTGEYDFGFGFGVAVPEVADNE
jgi:hypothetical protein